MTLQSASPLPDPGEAVVAPGPVLPPVPVEESPDSEIVLAQLFREGRLSVTQTPLVDLESGEALAVALVTHGPSESPWAARTLRRLLAESPHVHSLGLAQREFALRHLQQHSPGTGVPVVVDSPLPSLVELGLAGDSVDGSVVLLLDARGLLRRPAESLRLLSAARSEGWEIGLREVGADTATLAAVSVTEPALVILSPAVLADPTAPLAIETLQTVTAFHRSSGAVIAAEDLDSIEAVAAARALGASVGSGPMFDGAPVDPERAQQLFQLFTPPLPVPHHSPFELAVRRHPANQADKAMLLALSKRLEATAATAGSSGLVLAAFQRDEHVTPATRARYADLAEQCCTVVMAAQGLELVPPGVTMSPLDQSDPLVDEWNLIVLTPTMSAMLAARDRHARTPRQADRQFDYVLSYDRDLVAHAARSLLTRVTATV